MDGDANGAGEVDAVGVGAVAGRGDGDVVHLDGMAGVEGEVELWTAPDRYPRHGYVGALVHPQSLPAARQQTFFLTIIS